MALGTLENFLWRPDGLVTDRALDRAEDDRHFGRLGSGRLKVVAADPPSQRLERSDVAGRNRLEDGAVAARLGRPVTSRRLIISAPSLVSEKNNQINSMLLDCFISCGNNTYFNNALFLTVENFLINCYRVEIIV